MSGFIVILSVYNMQTSSSNEFYCTWQYEFNFKSIIMLNKVVIRIACNFICKAGLNTMCCTSYLVEVQYFVTLKVIIVI